MRARAVALLAGLLFALGLGLSGMTQPEKVLGFLDVRGAWDPSLALVMGGAVLLGLFGFGAVLRRGRALTGDPLSLPTQRAIDARLLGGSVLFGLGWGVAGYCPGPALMSLVTLTPGPALFVLSMLAGMGLVRALDAMRERRAGVEAAA